MNVIRKSTSTVAILAASIALVACGGESENTESTGADEASASTPSETSIEESVSGDLPQGSEPANLDPAEFTTDIDNPYMPLAVGSRCEDTAEYENGKPVNQRGSFEAGVDGAEAGIVMPADPEVGMAYRQEYYEGEAEDRAEVLSLSEKAEVPTGYYPKTLMTKDLVPLEPKVSEHKFYAEGVGLVLALGHSGGAGREELVSFTPGD